MKYLVAIVGGAVSGAEAAHQLTERGVECVVFDQNLLPYGKIEDGLPKWHAKLRDKEENRINEKLGHDLVHFVPGVRLGRDIQFEDLARNWGFSAILLAIGAWRDRPLPIEGVDAYVGKGLIYQNPFIHWFNHKHETGADSGAYEIKDGAIVVGGGLASLDVVKVLMIETVIKALAERGHEVNMFDLDRSIAKVLDGLGLTLEDLGIEGCTLYYRRRIADMPLSPMPITSPETRAKVEGIREKILNNYAGKYLFNVEPLHVPVDKIVEDGTLKGLVFRQTRIEDGRAVPVPGTEKEVRAPYVISSIGSIPEPIPGIPHRGSMYDIIEEPCCRVSGFENVFAIGNTVTGRGNIKESLEHGRTISQRIIENYMDNTAELSMKASIATQRSEVKRSVDGLVPKISAIEPASRDAILERVGELWKLSGYDGNYNDWVAKHTPKRLEEIVGH